MKEIWVAEYSPSQKAFHRQPLAIAAFINLARDIKGDFTDYIIIGYGTQDECGKIIDLAMKHLP